ncbi:hypothetical protein MBLNU459_g6773t2 [Dothideomycetes sp. NU459]
MPVDSSNGTHTYSAFANSTSIRTASPSTSLTSDSNVSAPASSSSPTSDGVTTGTVTQKTQSSNASTAITSSLVNSSTTGSALVNINGTILPGPYSSLLSSAWSCLLALSTYTWETENDELRTATGLYTSVVPADVVTNTYTTQYNLSTYTLCDGIPRVTAGNLTNIRTLTTTTTLFAVSTRTGTLYATSSPPCTVAPSIYSQYCPALVSIYNGSITAEINGNRSIENVQPDCPESLFMPDYTPNACELQVQSAQMFYWPVSTVDGNFCAQNGSTVTATPTGDGPNTFNLNGIILTSPTVYVSFYNLEYYTSAPGYSSSFSTDSLIAFASSQISSQCGYHGADGIFPFNFQDLNTVPWSAYACQANCWFNTDYCIPMVTPYAPALAFPATFTAILSSLHGTGTEYCTLGVENDGVWDPPSALIAQPTLAVPSVAIASTTSTYVSHTQSAAPSSTASSVPQMTSVSAVPTTPSPSSAAQSPSMETQSSPTGSSIQSQPADPPTSSPQRPQDTVPQSQISTGNAVPQTSAQSVGASAGSTDPASADPTTSSDNVGAVIASVLGLTKPKTSDSATSSSVKSVDPEGSVAPGAAAGPTDTTQDPPTQVAAIFTIGSSTITAHSGSGLVIGSSTLTAAGAALTVSTGESGSIAVALASGGIIVGGTTAAYSQLEVPSSSPIVAIPATQSGAVVTFGSSAITAHSGGPLVIGSSTLTAGGAAMTLSSGPSSGVIVSVGSQGLVVGSNTMTYSQLANSPSDVPATRVGAVLTIGSSTITVHSGSPVIIGSATLTAGGSDITLTSGPSSGVVVSVASQGIVVGGSTFTYNPLAASTVPTSGAVFAVGSQTYTASEVSGGTIVVDGTTIGPNAAATINGHIVSLAPSGVVVDATQTIDFSALSNTASNPTAGGSQSGLYVDAIVIQGTTLHPGGPAMTIAGQVISDASTGLVIGGTQTIPFGASATGVGVRQSLGAILTLSTSVIQAYEVPGNSDEVVVQGETLSIGGPAATIDGVEVSDAPGGIVLGTTKTVPISKIPVGTSQASQLVFTRTVREHYWDSRADQRRLGPVSSDEWSFGLFYIEEK